MAFYRPCLLDAGKHRRDDFCCDHPELDDWLRRYAGQNRKRDTAATRVVVDEQSRVAGYMSLSMSAVVRSDAPARLAKGAPDPVPALLIGRLAVDRSATGLGIGATLVRSALQTAVDINAAAACRAVRVTVLDESAHRWWQPFGFVPFDPADPANLDLYLLTADIARTLERLT